MYLLNNLKFDAGKSHTIGDTQYPRGWFLIPANRAAVGIVEVPDPVWPDPLLFSAVENPDGTLTVTPLAPAAIAALEAEALELARERSVTVTINTDTVVNQLRAMTNAEYNTWWAANVTNAAQAITLLKRLTRIVVRSHRPL